MADFNEHMHHHGEYWGGCDYHHLIHGDTEHAHVIQPWESCCEKDDPDDCICVTSADVELWNTVSAISAISGIENLSALSSVEKVLTSADIWNGTYNTVDANSANWNSAYNALSSINDELDSLSSAITEKNKVYVDTDIFSGNGTVEDPLSIISGAEYKTTIQHLVALAHSAFAGGNIDKKNWLDKKDYADLFDRIEHERKLNISQTSAININWEHIEEIIKRLKTFLPRDEYHPLKNGTGITIDSDYKVNVKDYNKIVLSANKGAEAFNYVKSNSADNVKYVKSQITKENLSTLTADNTLYYSFTD